MIFLLPSSVTARIAEYGGSWGYLDVRHDPAENVVVLSGASKGESLKRPVSSDWLAGHYTSATSPRTGVGIWYLADAGLELDGQVAAARGGGLDAQTEFRPRVGSWRIPPPSGWFVLTCASTDNDADDWAGWRVTPETATYLPVILVDEDAGLLAPLAGVWPLEILADVHVALIGAGSIGSAATEALASYGIRHVTILDPDRLLPHNFARHRLHPRETGRPKATALRDHLLLREPALDVSALELNVIRDADDVRPLMREIDLLVVCTDGVASRRVANHLAAWAGRPAVFACVIEDGAYGEVLRVRPNTTGCLSCDRDALIARGELDPEPQLDEGYPGAGGARPMTAVGGDLAFVGQLAAKIAVATLLEQQGDRSQTLPGDALTVALRPVPELATPFDLEKTLEFSWRPLPPSDPACPSCGRER